MPEIDAQRERTASQAGWPEETHRGQRPGIFAPRFLFLYAGLSTLILLAILPPLINVNRFKRRIVTSISASIGRPVHLDSVSLVLLPVPGFRLENFVVAEDPAFGAEPVIHANQVEATLRFSSLWRRKVEFSKISLQEPSINLVHSASGSWNVETILLQAARIPAAPTAQVKSGPTPRFPYIEATSARVNIKSGDEKLPFSLTEADFALWLPNPGQWRIRIVGKPTRTDTSASDTGRVSLEGTLGRAERFDLIPLDLAAEWRNAPLGEASRLILGRDAGLRGDLRLNVALHGTVGNSLVDTILSLDSARRADFVPQQPLNLRAECQATAVATFHALMGVSCSWPPPGEPATLALTGDLPDLRDLSTASFEAGTPRLPAPVLLNWLRIASPRVSSDITVTGTLTGRIGRGLQSAPGKAAETAAPERWSGKATLIGGSILGSVIGDTPVVIGDATVASRPFVESRSTPAKKIPRRLRKEPVAVTQLDGFVMSPTTLTLGGKEPAILEGRFDPIGYTLHLSGSVMTSRLLALATAIPQFGDGIAAVLPQQTSAPGKELPVAIDLVSARPWGGGQRWFAAPSRSTTRRAAALHR